MATYKVIQDIEAEDKLLGPLSLRQFIYASIVIITGFVAFRLMMVNPLLVLPFLPPIVFFGLLAAPFGKDQSSEIWLLAKIRYHIKPRRRIWDQSGMEELVSITAPKHIEANRTKDFSQTEVRSRLKALANTIDSRGWAIKNVNVNLFDQDYMGASEDSDRLIDLSTMPQEVSGLDIQAADDMLDETSNPTAQKLDQMITSSQKSYRQEVVKKMHEHTEPQAPQPAPNYWFMSQDPSSTQNPSVVSPGQPAAASMPTKAPTTDEQALLQQIHANQAKPKAAYGHMKVIDPLGSPKTVTPPTQTPAVPAPTDPAITSLPFNNDLSVATISRQANKQHPTDDEVVVNLR